MIEMTRNSLAVATLAAVLFVGCTPNLYAITTPPPTRTAELRSENPIFAKRKHFARLSAGVALAFNCSRSGPCRGATAASDDPSIARVERAHLNRLEQDLMSADSRSPATFVLVGVRPGETWVRVRSKSGNAKIKVTVE
jgi:hypothetical protein